MNDVGGMGMMDEAGSYKPDSGRHDDLGTKPEGSLVINPKTVSGLENYRPGDTLILKVKVRWPKDAQEQEGMLEPEIVNITAEPMADGARVTRMRENVGRP